LPTPDPAPAALLLVDVINPFDFDGAEKLLEHARPAAKRIAVLKRHAKAAGVPTIYANDHFGRWRDDFRAVLKRATGPKAAGRDIVRLVEPEEDATSSSSRDTRPSSAPRSTSSWPASRPTR
jgi:nicotinamidase-related amidase